MRAVLLQVLGRVATSVLLAALTVLLRRTRR